MTTDLLKLNHIQDMESNDSDISDIWDCDENALDYMVELGITAKWVDKNHKTTVKDLESIL